MAKDRRSMTIDEIMGMNKVDARASLPPGFPPPPPPIGDFKGKSEDEYKEYMRQKLQREQWENSLTLYRMREREGNSFLNILLLFCFLENENFIIIWWLTYSNLRDLR